MTAIDDPILADEVSAPPESVTRPRWPHALAALALAVLLLGYGGLLAAYFSPAIVHPDANGYWAQGTRIVTTGRSWFVPESNAQYIGMHWLLAPDGKYVSRYPPGFPAVIGLVYATHSAGRRA